jgi:hypothetical protein
MFSKTAVGKLIICVYVISRLLIKVGSYLGILMYWSLKKTHADLLAFVSFEI